MLVDELYFPWGPPFSKTHIYSLKWVKNELKKRQSFSDLKKSKHLLINASIKTLKSQT